MSPRRTKLQWVSCAGLTQSPMGRAGEGEAESYSLGKVSGPLFRPPNEVQRAQGEAGGLLNGLALRPMGSVAGGAPPPSGPHVLICEMEPRAGLAWQLHGTAAKP